MTQDVVAKGPDAWQFVPVYRTRQELEAARKAETRAVAAAVAAKKKPPPARGHKYMVSGLMHPRRGDRDSVPPPAESGTSGVPPGKRRTRSALLDDRRAQRIACNQAFAPIPAPTPEVTTAWWKDEPGYVETPPMRASKDLTSTPATRCVTLAQVADGQGRKTQISEKITRERFRPATAGARQPQLERWTDAVFHFSLPENVQNQRLMDKYDLSFKLPLDSSFTHDKVFREENIKGGIKQRVVDAAVDPAAFDKSAKATRRRMAESRRRRQQLDAYKAAEGLLDERDDLPAKTVRFADDEARSHLFEIRDSRRVRSGGFDMVGQLGKLHV
ncbi:hypothetical protein ACHHYP_08650 [Achlya hypogyna]|uniref:Uncharacterized protein n=1 Tax=Achlya hypogyna TaxID=1202772 RepID=A0A1V9ZK94_ACHHY|nr:hypothetical protein ACHHYP_08650 [Achlya hypogyna]